MEAFFSRISSLLSAKDLEIFKNEYNKPSFRGVRVNTLKCTGDKFVSLVEGIDKDKVTPFCKDGFYIPEDCDFGGNHPLHHAGAVYFQEPSAMSAASVLKPEEGDRVLDLCAAPGGKTTQLASYLNGTGLLWSNEIVKSRANILLSNTERCGVRNCVVSSCDPETLCTALSGVFDKVLVDAPCSGEGMFRRDKAARDEWSPEHSDSCAVRQLKILNSAKKALRDGGVLVYSTCTFSYKENEGVIEEFLRENPDFELIDCEESFGRRTLNGLACRIYPMDGGEGHFAAKLRKKETFDGGIYRTAHTTNPTDKKKIPAFVTDFLNDCFYDISDYSRLLVLGDRVYALPEYCPDVKGTGVLRAGVYVGNIKKNYFEPEHHLFMSADIKNVKRVVDLSLCDERVRKFLRGEEIPVEDNIKGYTAVAVEGIITGFGKVSGGMLKNKYPKGLRLL
ncbi:MAG: hypothetical protein E7563_06420 [Ruminococcaceae bacterium]|nr:hypothetical protein [Oscillospiraceae bacterium]